MILHAVAFTDRGMETGRKLPGLASLTRCPRGGLASWTAEHWTQGEGLLFIGAVGIAVRAIAPHVVKKTVDPAVLVLDESGGYVIPILSGHIGGANAAALEIARTIGAVPIITTATDLNGMFAVDTWAVSQKLAIRNPEAIKLISGKLLAGKTVCLSSSFPIQGDYPKGVIKGEPADIVISPRKQPEGALHLVPKCVALGIGCRKGISQTAIEALYQTLSLEDAAVAGVFSIDLKKEEPGLKAFCSAHGFPFYTYSPEQLRNVPGNFSSSAFVASVTGVDNVCERAALMGGGTLWVPKTAENGVTMAASIREPDLTFGG